MKNVDIYLENNLKLKAKTNFVEDFAISGELVFTTSMTGYQEIITDPSFAGQIVVLTYPLIGNYGVNLNWSQSEKIYAKGLIVNQIESDGEDFSDFEIFLQQCKIPIIHSVDTRNLVHLIREHFYPKCIISTKEIDSIKRDLLYSQVNPNVVDEISVKEIKTEEGFIKNGKKIGIIDFGLKAGIVENLKEYFEAVFILPFDTEPEEILQMNLSSILLSNGPGDPAVLRNVIKNIANLLGKIDIFGICLGHQLLALALGYKTRIMPFGHRGANHPVIDLRSKKVIITTQNHGYEIDESSLDGDVFVTHRNLHDNSIEGIMSLKHNARSVQFHPEAAPGTHDAKVIFKDWFEADY